MIELEELRSRKIGKSTDQIFKITGYTQNKNFYEEDILFTRYFRDKETAVQYLKEMNWRYEEC